MSPVWGRPFSRRGGSEPLLAADTERLLARHRPHPEAPAAQHALAELLDWAARPPSDEELAGEAAAVARFVLATGGRSARSVPFLTRAGGRSAVVAGLGAAVVMALSGAAAADALPAPVQELAHTTFGAPAPRHPAARHPAPRPSPSLPQATTPPAPAASPSPSSQHGKAKAVGKKAKKGGPGNGKAKGKAKAKAVPPGHQKA